VVGDATLIFHTLFRKYGLYIRVVPIRKVSRS
jgi:hypothetical protein